MHDSEKKLSILFTFIPNHIGGAATSLTNLLNTIDTNKYEIDLLFYTNNEINDNIISNVNILSQALKCNSTSFKGLIKRIFDYKYMLSKIKSQYYIKIKKNKVRGVQEISRYGCRYSRRLNKQYDVAISYESGWCMYYTMKCVNARRKVLWQHNDYHEIGYDFKLDKKYFDLCDGIVFVSNECKDKFLKLHKEYSGKSYFIPNILSEKTLFKRTHEKVELPFEKNNSILTLVSVARIDFSTKGHDRIVKVFLRLKKDNLLSKVRLLVIGEGRNQDDFVRLIKENHLEKNIFYIGLKLNPMPYMKECDALFLPSKNEGKPMVVTEALILGIVPIVTNYTSAKGQIRNGYDGLIFDNNEDAIYEGLKSVICDMQNLYLLRTNIRNNHYGNEGQVQMFYDMIDKLFT